jgi:hypothetical protein
MSEPPSAPTKWTAPPTALICRVVDNLNGKMATYYLEIHSGAFDFSPCNSGVARISIRFGDPSHPDEGLAPGAQKHCYYSTTTDHSVKGAIAAISTNDPANLAAVQALCAAHHGVPS